MKLKSTALLVWALTCLIVLAESPINPDSEVKKLAGDMKFTEGPVWLPIEKKLIFSDIPNNRLMQWSEADGLTVFRQDSKQTNGNILDLEGRLVSCQHAGRNLTRTEPNGEITVLADKFDGKRFNSPNDVAVTSDGTLWFTDPPWGLKGEHEIPGHWVFKLNPETGKVEPVIKDLAMPNGILFSPDEKRLYVADTGGHKRHPDAAFHKTPAGVYCYSFSETGEIGEKLFQLSSGSDGMAVDVEGNIYTTHGSAVHVYDADLNEIGKIETPEGPANCTFGGEDYKTLFITARTSLYSVRVRIAGAKPKGAAW
ncbi:MAG: gluconolactonase [Verrucomicrobiales bacterium]|jgi:gluconolactonase